MYVSGRGSAQELNHGIKATGLNPKQTQTSEQVLYPTGCGVTGYSLRFKGQALSSTR
ncbi:MAG: hypothetical protein AAF699_20350 [Pseudomonadota bacterium]